MPKTPQSSDNPFIEVDYAAKIAFAPSHDRQEPPDVRTIWQQSQGLWKDHPIFHGMPVGNVIAWLRGKDSHD